MTPGTRFVVLTLAEICERTNIDFNLINPKRISTLGLPGSIDEKLTAVGNSLTTFTRLKKLDLSRNAISNVDGLSALKALEELYLYYNLISSTNELNRLKDNQNLKVVDLRLNPVTKSDYRSMLISILPKLELLDERVVSLPERKLAESLRGETIKSTKIEVNGSQQNSLSQSGSFTEILKCLNEIQSPVNTVSMRSFSPVSQLPTDDEVVVSERLQLPDDNSAMINFSKIYDDVTKNICCAINNSEKIHAQNVVKWEVEKLVSCLSSYYSSAVLKISNTEHANLTKKRSFIDWGCQTDFSVSNCEIMSTAEHKKNCESKLKLEQLEKQLVHSKRYEKLTNMLQESHDVLVRTNAQLVKELEEMRLRHYTEIAELTEQYRLATTDLHSFSHATEETGFSEAESEF